MINADGLAMAVADQVAAREVRHHAPLMLLLDHHQRIFEPEFGILAGLERLVGGGVERVLRPGLGVNRPLPQRQIGHRDLDRHYRALAVDLRLADS